MEPAGAASMHAALEAGQPMSLAKVDPFVDGTAVGRAGALPFHIASQFVDCVLVVPEGAVCTEMLELYQSDGVIAEPAGALASTAAHVFLTDPPIARHFWVAATARSCALCQEVTTI